MERDSELNESFNLQVLDSKFSTWGELLVAVSCGTLAFEGYNKQGVVSVHWGGYGYTQLGTVCFFESIDMKDGPVKSGYPGKSQVFPG